MKTILVPYNSVLAILDRALRMAPLSPSYVLQEYEDRETGKKRYGILLTHLEEQHPSKIFTKKQGEKVGMLCFVNGEEPGKGTMPLHAVMPKENDELALAYVVQGIYKGDFSRDKKAEGLHVVLPSYKIKKEDLQKKTYALHVEAKEIISMVEH